MCKKTYIIRNIIYMMEGDVCRGDAEGSLLMNRKGLSELSFSEVYFCDEIRDGFFVSETMKHYWAASLKV